MQTDEDLCDRPGWNSYITAALFGSIVAGPAGQISLGAPVREIVLVNGPIHYDILVPAQVIRDQMPWLSD